MVGGKDPGFEGTERFQVESVLGNGASGVVYRVHDREAERDVALKTLASVDPDWRFRLKAEFRGLASILHPNLVELYELVSDDRHCFFTMELLDGPTFSAAFPPGQGARDLRRLGDVASQLVDALTALHAAGKLHRDVKPSNVIVTSADLERAVLVDFGLCAELRMLRRGVGEFAGTLLYMSPEQAWGQALSPAADWYALGAMTYEALVGEPAFPGAGAALLMAKQRAPEVPRHVSGAARDAVHVCARLMDPDPKRRPAPTELLEALEARPSSRCAPISSGANAKAPLVGRDAELAVLEAAFEEAKGGRPAVALVTGPSGIGKSELLASFLSRREADGTVLLHGRCHPQESVAYDGLDGAIDELSEWLLSLDEIERDALLPEGAFALVDLFPVLGRVVRATPRVERPTEPIVRRREGVAALRTLLRRMRDKHPVVLSIDDAHWGGADAGALLAELLREGAPSVLLVLAFREEDSATSPLLGVLRERAPDLLETIHTAALGPLDERSSEELARHLIAHDRDDADAMTMSVSAAGKGHPLFLRELALAVTVSKAPIDGSARSVDLDTLLRERIAVLDADERSLLDLASVAGRPIARSTLLAAAGQGEPGRLLLQKLGKRRLLRETTHGAAGAPTFEPYHAKIRDAALGAIDVDARRSAHRVLAEALMRDPEPHADQLVDHLEGAGDRARAASFSRIAAEHAERMLAFDRAAHFYRRAITLGSDERSRLFARTAAALASAGESVAAAQAYGEAADIARAEGLADAGDLARLAAEHDLRGGNFERGIRRLKDVLRGAGVPYPSSALTAFADVLYFRTRLAIRGLDFEVRPAAEQDPSLLARLDACWTAGLGLGWIDRTRTAAFQARYMVSALDCGDARRIVRGLATEASQLACLGGTKRTTKARAVLRKALDLLEPNDHVGRAFTLCLSGSIEFYASRWRDALTQCRLGERVLESAGLRSEWEAMTSYTLSFASLAYLGEIRELQLKQHALLTDARDRGNRLAETCLSSGPANLSWLAADAPDEAERRAARALSPWRYDDFQLAHYLHLVAKAQIDLYRGCPRDALERLRREWRSVVLSMSLHVQNFRVTLRHLRARAAIAAAVLDRDRSDRDALLSSAREQARHLAREDVAWAGPLMLATEAGILSASGEEERALVYLTRAVRGFEDLEMKLYANAAIYARGRLVGGALGRELVARAERSMLAENIVRPDLVSAMLVPTSAR